VSSWGEDSSSGWNDTSVPTEYEYSEIKKPPKWPLILQIAIILISAILFWIGPNLLKTQKLTISVIGYLLTPFLVVLMLAILRMIDMKNRSLPWYDRGLGKDYVKLAGRLSLLAFVMAAPIIWRLAIEIVN
jgi:amino acid transporter